MEVGIALVAGLIIGWLIEWVIDWQYWRRGVAGFYTKEAQLNAKLASQQQALDDVTRALEQSKTELSATRAQLQAAKAKESQLQRQLDATTATEHN